MATLPRPKEAIDAHAATEMVGSAASDETCTRPSAPDNPDSPRFARPSHDGDIGRLGKYRIQKELGRGGMGAVYLAFDERLQRKVALKVMLPRSAADATAKERFLREARAAAQISSDHVVNIFEADEIDGIPFIALQFLQGYPLDEYLRKKGDLTLPQAVRIATDTALGLAKAHKLGIVHRDIKPGNLWLEAPTGRVKILDFGLAKPVIGAEGAELTGSGAIMGTPAYMAPEQGMGKTVDVRADLFSLGCVLYRLCTGKLPFDRPTIMAILTAIAVDEPTPVLELNPDVPEPLADLIRRLMSKNPDQRPASAQEVVKELDRISALVKSGSKADLSDSQPQVVYVPVAVSIVEPNPFEDIGDASTNFDSLQSPKAVLPPKPPKKFPAKLVGGLALGLVAIVTAGIIIKITNKDGTTTTIEVPDGSKIEVNGKTIQAGPKTEPPKKDNPGAPPVDSLSERKAAEWVLGAGGWLVIHKKLPDGQWVGAQILTAADLPKQEFHVFQADLLNIPDITDESLSKLKACSNLNILSCKGPGVTDKGLLILREWKNLSQLFLSGTSITDEGLSQVAECRKLTFLHLDGAKVTDAGLARLKPLEGLMQLRTVSVPVGDAFLSELKDFTILQDLDLRGTKITNAGINSLKACKWLIYLDLRGTKATEEKIAELKKALPRCKIHSDGGTIEPNLDADRKAAEWVLSVGGHVLACNPDQVMKRLEPNGVEVKPGGSLPKDPFRLTAVFLDSPMKITDDGLANLSTCSNVKWLVIAGAPVTDKGLAHLKGMTQLAQLTLAHMKDLTDEGLTHVKTLHDLVSLDLASTMIGDAGLAHLKECKLMSHLNLIGTKISDAGLAHLKDYKILTTLHLHSTAISDIGLEHLKTIKTLTFIDVRTTKVTAAKIEEFRKALPKCRIESDHGTFEPK